MGRVASRVAGSGNSYSTCKNAQKLNGRVASRLTG